MRKLFVDWLFEKMKTDPNVVLVTADLGFGLLDRIRDTYPDRFWNVGAAEQLLLGVGVGLSLEGKKPILYSITPFLLYRPYEWIRNYLGHERISCMLVGSGLDKDYSHDGFSHWSFDYKEICDQVKIDCILPNEDNMASLMDKAIDSNSPCFVGLKR